MWLDFFPTSTVDRSTDKLKSFFFFGVKKSEELKWVVTLMLRLVGGIFFYGWKYENIFIFSRRFEIIFFEDIVFLERKITSKILPLQWKSNISIKKGIFTIVKTPNDSRYHLKPPVTNHYTLPTTVVHRGLHRPTTTRHLH